MLRAEGHAVCIIGTNDERWTDKAEVLREKGTDRARFMRREVSSYAWQDLGSSGVVSELVAAYLYGQLQELQAITIQ